MPDLRIQSAISSNGAQLPSEDALRVEPGEFWLKLGEADEALRKLRSWGRGAWIAVGAGDPDCDNGGGEGGRTSRGRVFFRAPPRSFMQAHKPGAAVVLRPKMNRLVVYNFAGGGLGATPVRGGLGLLITAGARSPNAPR